jgi:hypothetical protein
LVVAGDAYLDPSAFRSHREAVCGWQNDVPQEKATRLLELCFPIRRTAAL